MSISKSPAVSDGACAEELVRALFRGLLGREPEPQALRYWCDVMRSSEGDVAPVARAIAASAEYAAGASKRVQHSEARNLLSRSALPLLAIEPLTVVDVGAQKLAYEDHIYSSFQKFDLPCRVIGFEPLKDKIANNHSLHPKSDVLLYPTFIGDGGAHIFCINNDDATSSLLPFNAELTSKLVDLSHLHTVQTEKIETKTLDQTLADVGRVDFLKLDIQGFELTALQHATDVLARTNVVHCEVSFAEIYQGQALFSEVEQWMRKAGFYFLDFSTSCRYAYHCASGETSKDRLGWGDAVFFKELGLLKSKRDVLAQALAAMFVYEKYSIAEFLMTQCDS